MTELDVTRPFSTQQALADGITRSVLASSRYRQIVRGIHVSAAVADVHADARAALMVASVRSAFVSHHLAARLYGAVVPDTPYLHVSVPPGVKRRRRDGVVVHHSAREAVRFRQLRVTSPEDTFLDLAAHLHLVDLVVLGDGLVRKGRTTTDRLVEAALHASGRGVRLARRAATLVRPRVDSPMETRCRMLRVLSGLPELETDIRFHDEHGNLRRRLDAGDRATRTAVEYDATSSGRASGRPTWDGVRSSRTPSGGSSRWSARTSTGPLTRPLSGWNGSFGSGVSGWGGAARSGVATSRGDDDVHRVPHFGRSAGPCLRQKWVSRRDGARRSRRPDPHPPAAQSPTASCARLTSRGSGRSTMSWSLPS